MIIAACFGSPTTTKLLLLERLHIGCHIVKRTNDERTHTHTNKGQSTQTRRQTSNKSKQTRFDAMQVQIP